MEEELPIRKRKWDLKIWKEREKFVEKLAWLIILTGAVVFFLLLVAGA